MFKFSDFSPAEEYYQDAVWAWNLGIFDKNEDMSIHPFDPATHEFTAHTSISCLHLGLSDSDVSTYSIIKEGRKKEPRRFTNVIYVELNKKQVHHVSESVQEKRWAFLF